MQNICENSLVIKSSSYVTHIYLHNGVKTHKNWGKYLQLIQLVWVSSTLYSSIVYRHAFLSIATGSAVFMNLAQYPRLPFCILIYLYQYRLFHSFSLHSLCILLYICRSHLGYYTNRFWYCICSATASWLRVEQG